MWKFGRKPKEPEPVTTQVSETAKPVEQIPVIDRDQIGRDIRELLGKIAQENPDGAKEVKFLTGAFKKAAKAVLEDQALASVETVQAFASFANAAKNQDLRNEAVSKLAAMALKYREHTVSGIAVLGTALSSADPEVRHSAIFSLRDIGAKYEEHSGAVVQLMTAALENQNVDVREKAVIGLTSMAVQYGVHSEAVTKTLAGLLSNTNEPVKPGQQYRVCIEAAHGLSEIGLAHQTQADAAIKGIAAGLANKEIFVRYRAIEGLNALGLKYASRIDEIVDVLKKAQKDDILVVKEKIGSAINSLKPPVEPEKTPQEIEAERQRQEKLQAVHDAAIRAQQENARLKQEAETQQKGRYDDIGSLVKRLPGLDV